MKEKLQRLTGGLGRDQVVRAGLELLDDVGLDGLTMRALADRLGVKAASLYWHVRDKEQLLDLVHAAISAEVRAPDPALPWRERLEDWMWAWRRVLLSHRDAARVAYGRGLASDPATLLAAERTLGALVEAGLSPPDAAAAGYLLSNFVPGFVAEETAARAGGRGQAAVSEEAMDVARNGRERATLALAGGVSETTLLADAELVSLCRVRHPGRPPRLDVRGETVTIRSGRGLEVRLNPSVAWRVHVAGGVDKVDADLAGLSLRGLDVAGGARRLALSLPRPEGTVTVALAGGVSRVELHRPTGVPARINVRGAASQLTFDTQRMGSISHVQLESPGYQEAADRYEVTIGGGVSRLLLDHAGETPRIHPVRRGEEPPDMAAALDPALYPNLTAVAAVVARPDMDELFRFGLGTILDGLETRRPAQR